MTPTICYWSKLTARVTPMDEIEPEEVDWLWGNRIPLGKLTDVVGDPGTGKSTVMAEIAAAISTGDSLPLEGEAVDREPADVLILSAEDDAGDTIRPRLESAGADLTKVHVLEGMVSDEGNEVHLNLSNEEHLKVLRRVIKEHEPVLVVIDPLTAYMGDIDTYRDSRVRALLSPLAKLAEEHGTAIVFVRHLRKSSASRAIYRAGGSIGFSAAVRSELLIARDPKDPDERAVIQVKNNLAPSAESVAFSLRDDGVVWKGESVLTPEDVLADDDGKVRPRDVAKKFLRQFLASGPCPATQVEDAADDRGIARKTLHRAKDELNVESKKHGYGDSGYWTWCLPGSSADEGPDEPDTGLVQPEPKAPGSGEVGNQSSIPVDPGIPADSQPEGGQYQSDTCDQAESGLGVREIIPGDLASDS